MELFYTWAKAKFECRPTVQTLEESLVLLKEIPEHPETVNLSKKCKEKLEELKQQEIALAKAEETERARLAEEKRQEEIRLKEQKERQEKYRNAGLCQHCGGEIKGLFVKKCVKCGKKKDY